MQGLISGYIFPLLFFKRICDVYDEECQQILEEYGDEEATGVEENHRFQVPKGAHWNDVRLVSENVVCCHCRSFSQDSENTNIDKLQGNFR